MRFFTLIILTLLANSIAAAVEWCLLIVLRPIFYERACVWWKHYGSGPRLFTGANKHRRDALSFNQDLHQTRRSIHKAGRDTQTGTNKQRLNYRGRLRAVITNHYTPLLYSIASSPEPSCSRRCHPPLGLHSKCQKCNVWRVPRLLIPQMYAEIQRCKSKNDTFCLRFSAKQSHVHSWRVSNATLRFASIVVWLFGHENLVV